jgi:hypothetical protein
MNPSAAPPRWPNVAALTASVVALALLFATVALGPLLRPHVRASQVMVALFGLK